MQIPNYNLFILIP